MYTRYTISPWPNGISAFFAENLNCAVVICREVNPDASAGPTMTDWSGTMLDPAAGFIVGDIAGMVWRRVRAPRLIVPRDDSFYDISLSDMTRQDRPYSSTSSGPWHGPPNYHRDRRYIPSPVHLNCETGELLYCAANLRAGLFVNFEADVYPNISTFSPMLRCWRNNANHKLFENDLYKDSGYTVVYKDIVKCNNALLVETCNQTTLTKSFGLFDMNMCAFTAETPFTPVVTSGMAGGRPAFALDGVIKRVDARIDDLLTPISTEEHRGIFSMVVVDETLLAVKLVSGVALYDVRNGKKLATITDSLPDVYGDIFATE